MDWQDEGAILAMRPHGESAAIIEAFTARHGRHAGVVRGGASRKLAAILQPGSQVQVAWRARLEDHIGAFTVEPLRARAGLLADRRALAGLNAVCALLRLSLPEREPHPVLYQSTIALMDDLEAGNDWPARYVRWEVSLLEELGFGLDLTACAVTGGTTDLAYVSPRTGRAVGRSAAGAWADRLLPLPACLTGQGSANPEELAQGLAVTGHFLARELAPVLNDRALPDARARLVDLLGR
jgi:DNA repair protein RecO (recombination protein O)